MFINIINRYDPKIHHRRSIRLNGYDYAQAGLYFITLCVQHRKCLFGKIDKGIMNKNDVGKMVENEWLKLPERFPNIKLHEYIIMPNHIHSILQIVGATLVVAQNNVSNNAQNNIPIDNRATTRVAPTGKTIGDMIGAFKSITTVEYIDGVKTKKWQRFNRKLWQRNYWEHIIRDEKSYQNISAYIMGLLHNEFC